MALKWEANNSLRSFLKEQSEPLHTFCYFLLGEESRATEETLLFILRKFGVQYRKQRHAGENSLDLNETKIQLFRLAWSEIQSVSRKRATNVTAGRDTRRMASFNVSKNFFEEENPAMLSAAGKQQLVEHFCNIDLELRATLVLKDVLRFDDEQALRMLKIRWGVYRHRLHRGRTELRNFLRGRAFALSEMRTREFQLSP